jgi:hypothetical protein
MQAHPFFIRSGRPKQRQASFPSQSDLLVGTDAHSDKRFIQSFKLVSARAYWGASSGRLKLAHSFSRSGTKSQILANTNSYLRPLLDQFASACHGGTCSIVQKIAPSMRRWTASYLTRA